MPSYTRGKKREDLIFVYANNSILYGFKSKDLAAISGISASDIQTQLGHMTATAAAGAGAGLIQVVGANAPKPPRVTKKLLNNTAGTQKSVSTFCSTKTLSLALNNKWTLTKQAHGVLLRAASAGSGSLTAVAKLSNGALYAFSLNKADFDTYGAALGLESAATITTAAERAKLVRGSNLPRPGRCFKKLDDGSDFSSFYSTATDLGTQGFSAIDEEVVLTQTAGGGGGA